MSKELVDLELDVARDNEADLAILVRVVIPNLDCSDAAASFSVKKIWLPRSEIEIEYKDRSRTTAIVTMPEWLAIEKGLI